MLSPFPAEVLLMMAEHLPNNDLTALVRVNSFFHRTFVPYLYRCVEAIRLSRDASTASFPPLANEAYSRHVRCLNVRPHPPELCEDAPEHEVLHLPVIRLFLTAERPLHLLHDSDAWNPCSDEEEPDLYDQRDRLHAPEPMCDLLRNARAKTVIIAEIGLHKPASFVFLSGWMSTAVAVDNFVLFLPPRLSNLTTTEDKESWHALYDTYSAPTSIESLLTYTAGTRTLTVVVQHPCISAYEGPGPASLGSFARNLLRGSRSLIRGVVDISEDLCSNYIHDTWHELEEFTIVLPEGVLSSECRSYLQQTIRKKLDEHESDLKLPMPTVRILSMLEFMAHPEYAHVMTREQEETWRERSRLPHYDATLEYVQQCINWSLRRRELLRRSHRNYEDHSTFYASLGPPPWESQ